MIKIAEIKFECLKHNTIHTADLELSQGYLSTKCPKCNRIYRLIDGIFYADRPLFVIDFDITALENWFKENIFFETKEDAYRYWENKREERESLEQKKEEKRRKGIEKIWNVMQINRGKHLEEDPLKNLYQYLHSNILMVSKGKKNEKYRRKTVIRVRNDLYMITESRDQYLIKKLS